MAQQVGIDVLFDTSITGALLDDFTHALGRELATTDTEEDP